VASARRSGGVPGDWRRRIGHIPLIVAFGIGMCVKRAAAGNHDRCMHAMSPDRSPVCSVIVPVRNEAARIAGCVRAVRETAYRYPVEIVVVDGQSSDRTVDAADPP
jgi:hypothetical protein